MAFDPSKHLSKLSGKDYLEVKWRLVWLRDRFPDADLRTEHVQITTDIAVFKAEVTVFKDGAVAGRATGYGSETPKDFRDYIEKAETKSVGRALAALGLGTQFCGDELDEGDRIVDSPVERLSGPVSRGPRLVSNAGPGPSQAQDGASGFQGTEKQVNFLKGLAKERGFVGADGHADLVRLRREYQGYSTSQVIDALKATPIEEPEEEDDSEVYVDALKLAGQVARDWMPLVKHAPSKMIGDKVNWYKERMVGAVSRDELNGLGLLAKHDGLQDDELRSVYRTANDRLTEQARIAAGV